MKITGLSISIDRIFLSLASILIVIELCFGYSNDIVKPLISLVKKIDSPKEYFISQIVPIMQNLQKACDVNVEEKVSNIMGDLGIKAHVVNHSLQLCDKSIEFLVYIDKYKRSFKVRYIPLLNDVNSIIQKEAFKLEIRVFGAWRPLPLDSLFA